MGREDVINEYVRYLQLRERSPRTQDEYRRTLLRVGAWLFRIHGVELLDATAEHLAQWRATLEGRATNTVLGYATPVRGFYTWARKAGLRPDDPSEDLILPGARRGLPRPIGEADLEMAIRLAPLRIQPWLVLAGYAGLRAIEIAYLERRDLLDAAIPAMIMVNGKGGKQRSVPLSPYVWDELVAGGLPRRGFVFTRHDGRPGANRPALVSQLCNRHLHGLGLDSTLHALRHRFATRALVAAKGNLRVVQELLGHASVATTQIYTQIVSEDAVAAVLAIQPPHRLKDRA